jgi:hypothetical protein
MLTPNIGESISIAEYTDTTGTGSYRLLGALDGCFRFRDAKADGDSFQYFVTDGPNIEIVTGVLTYGTVDSLSRTTIEASSSGGAAVNWLGNTRPILRLTIGGAADDDDTCDMQDIYSGTSV